MTHVAIRLPDDLSCFVNEAVQSGDYQNADEFFASAVSLCKEQEEAQLTDEDQQKLDLLREDVQAAADQLDRGEGVRDRDWRAKLAERHLRLRSMLLGVFPAGGWREISRW